MNLTHEMKHMPPVVSQLHWAIERVLRPLGWELATWRGGYNSYCLSKPGEPRRYFPRWRRGNEIVVLDNYQHGAVVARLQTEQDVARFVVAVKTGKV